MPRSGHHPFADSLLYSELSTQQKNELQKLAKRREIAAHTYLFHQHSPAGSLYTIESGVLMVERSSPGGRRQILAFIFPGNFVGFTHNDFFEYSVQSLTPVTLHEYSRQEFLSLTEKIPMLKKNIDTITSNVMLRLFDQLFAIGQKKAHERVCFLLQQLKERYGANQCHFDLVMTRQDIADHLGLTLETVSRAFTRLQKEQVIKISTAHKVEILDPERLYEMAFSS